MVERRIMTDYNSFRDSKGLQNSDIIRVVRSVYPKYSKTQQSMINNPSKNAVCLLPEAEALLVKEFGNGPGLSISRKNRNHGNKAKPRRLCLRLSDDLYNQVTSLAEKMAFATMQDFLEAAVIEMIQRHTV